ncbi:MAG: Na-K-Cl cotransporter, partial [Calditrichota bacterium]
MSKQATKFGTFGGIFTPSILTILGVIMYLRLPWIVGNAGLWWTIGIILVSHIISITTGLSVASIATDKKVEAGGNYYIISRSLGLPIGGTLGIALFVGFSFSVSLYIIGFTESFLDYWNLPVSTQNIRIYGTITLLAVTSVTLFSTSLAIKMQYIIMLAIALSLISILFGSNELVPEQAAMYPPDGGVPIAVLFGIFFPAVTGFTTGVQMSGDLQDPKRS